MMTYNEFKNAFDEIGERPNLYHGERPESPLVRLSRFSREHPTTYASFRDRMKKENEQKYTRSRLPWE